MNPICQSCLRPEKKKVTLVVRISPDSTSEVRCRQSANSKLRIKQSGIHFCEADHVTAIFLASAFSFV